MLKMSSSGRYARVQTFAKVVESFVDRHLWQVIPDLLLKHVGYDMTSTVTSFGSVSKLTS